MTNSMVRRLRVLQARARNSSRPEPPDVTGPTLERIASLTSIARWSWLASISACLYTWLALATLNDIDFFLPQKTLTLPIVGTEIDPVGYAVFAPALLLALYIYFQLMFAQLLQCYEKLRELNADALKGEGGHPVRDLVQPWLMAALIPTRPHGLELVSKIFAHFLCWFVTPITVFAIAWRYLPTHDTSLIAYHCFVLALSLVSMAMFEIYRFEIRFRNGTRKSRSKSPKALLPSYIAGNKLVTAIGSVSALSVVLFETSESLISHPWPEKYRMISPHANLQYAQLNADPPGWDEKMVKLHSGRVRLYKELKDQEHLCERSTAEFSQENMKSKIDADGNQTQECLTYSETQEDLARLEAEIDAHLGTLKPVQMGHVPGPQKVNPTTITAESLSDDLQPNIFCRSTDITRDLIDWARDLRFADLRISDLFAADLFCADLRGADLRWSNLERSNLQAAMMSSADLSYASLRSATLYGADLSEAILKEAALVDTLLTDTWLDGANLEGSYIEGGRHSNTKLQDAFLFGTTIYNVEFGFAEMQGADFKSTFIRGSTSIYESNLKLTRFRDTHTSGDEVFPFSDFDGAVFRRTSIYGTSISQEQLNSAFGDGGVNLGPGYHHPTHWPDKEVDDDETFYGLWLTWAEECKHIKSDKDRPRWAQEYEAIPWDAQKWGELTCGPSP